MRRSQIRLRRGRIADHLSRRCASKIRRIGYRQHRHAVSTLHQLHTDADSHAAVNANDHADINRIASTDCDFNCNADRLTDLHFHPNTDCKASAHLDAEYCVNRQ